LRRKLIVFLSCILLFLVGFSCTQRYGKKEQVLDNISNLASEDFSTRIKAQGFLVQEGDRYIPLLLMYLKDENRDIREGIVWVLGELKSKEAVEPLIAVLKTDDDWIVRSYAAISLGEIGDPRAVQPLVDVLNSTSIANVMASSSAAGALGEIGDDSATLPLISALKDVSVRASAIDALGKIGNPVAIPFLWEIFIAESDLEIIEKTSVSLVWLREGEEKYIEDLGSANPEIRKKAEEILLSTGGSSLEILIEALKNNNHSVRIGSARILGQLGDSSAVGPLCIALENEDDPRLKKELKEIINNLQSSVKQWVKDLDSSDLDKRQTAIDALTAMDKKAVLPLVSALKESETTKIPSIVEILGNIGDPRAVKPLIELLSQNEPLLRYLTIEALFKIGDKDTLIRCIDHEDPLVRSGICEVLGALNAEEAIDLLLERLEKDDSEDVKRSASMAISYISSPSSVDPLIYMVYYGDNNTVMYSIQTLGDMKVEESLEALIASLYHYDPLVRAAAAEAMGKIGSPKVIPGLKEALLGEENVYVRENLEEAIEKIERKEM